MPKTRVKYLIVFCLRVERRLLTRPFTRQIRAKNDKKANAIFKLWKQRKPKEFVNARLVKKITTFRQLA